MGRYEKAKEMAEEAERVANKYFGTESKNYAYILNCLGSVYAKMGKEKDAKDKFETALRIFRQNYLSDNNLDVVYTYLKIASLYKLNKNIDGVNKIPDSLKKAYDSLNEISEESLAKKRAFAHAYTIQAKYCYLSGKYDSAIEFCEKAIQLSLEFGENHPKMIDTNIVYGKVLLLTRHFEDALNRFEMAHDKLLTLNEGHPDVIICKNSIERCKTEMMTQ